jgi:DNA-binding CsgD family transcriptional regulator
MYLYERIVKAIRKKFQRMFKRNFFLDVGTLHDIKIVASLEKREPEDIARQILKDGLRSRLEPDYTLTRWDALSPREKDVAALICLGFTSRQIAARLRISPQTVKTHAENVLMKFTLHSRNELRRVLQHWDFSAWDE